MGKTTIGTKIIIVFALINILCITYKSSSISEPNGDGGIYIPESCTIFTTTIGEKIYFSNNEDYKYDGTYIWLIPSQERYTPSGYIQINGGVFFGFDDNNDPKVDGNPQGGMNDKGLCLDSNGLPPTEVNYSSGISFPYIHPFFEILWECSTVNETIEWFTTHYFQTYMGCQIHFADASGDAVVASVDADGNFAFTQINNTSYLVSTNFNLANIENGHYPCQRYETACSMLEDITTEDSLTIKACSDVLDAVHGEGEYRTRYSNIFDITNREIYIYHDRNYERVAKLNLVEELAKILPEADGTEIKNFVYCKSIRIADLTYQSTKSLSVYSIVLIAGLAGITIISKRFSVRSKLKIKMFNL
ncbi:MAG: hypothetical protein GPJ52_00390 [Candidatus Heimdallarchaeota archaeon]|nr:hypothetical protein [Candidatus Heimdallarchaeota archaeon]